MSTSYYNSMPPASRSRSRTPSPPPNRHPRWMPPDEVVINFPDHQLIRHRREADNMFHCPGCKAVFTHTRPCYRHIRFDCVPYRKYHESRTAPSPAPLQPQPQSQMRTRDPRPWPQGRKPPLQDKNPLFINPDQRGGLRAQQEREYQRRRNENMPPHVQEPPHVSPQNATEISRYANDRYPNTIKPQSEQVNVPPHKQTSAPPYPTGAIDQHMQDNLNPLADRQASPSEDSQMSNIEHATTACEYDRESSPEDMDMSSDSIQSMAVEEPEDIATSILEQIRGDLPSNPELTFGDSASETSSVHTPALGGEWIASSPSPAPCGSGAVTPPVVPANLFFSTPQPTTNLMPLSEPEVSEGCTVPPASVPPNSDSPVLAFLNSLSPPLGRRYAAFDALGIASDQDLDLLATLPQEWETVRNELAQRGLTLMEWFHVKRALEARRDGIAGVSVSVSLDPKSLLTRISPVKAERLY